MQGFLASLFSALYEVSARNSKRHLVVYCGFVLALQQGFLSFACNVCRLGVIGEVLFTSTFSYCSCLCTYYQRNILCVELVLIPICCVVGPHYYLCNSYTQHDAIYQNIMKCLLINLVVLASQYGLKEKRFISSSKKLLF
jgi:hypothetical protein